MSFFKSLFLLIFAFLYFSCYSTASTLEEANLFFDFTRSILPSAPFPVGDEVDDFTRIQTLLNVVDSDSLNLSSIPQIHRVTSFAEAQPHLDELQAGDIWFSDVDGTLVDKECKLMEPGIVKRLENAKKRKISVLALTAARHPNENKERKLAKRNLRFSDTFEGLTHLDARFSTLNKGILSSRGEKKRVTVRRFLKAAYPCDEMKLRNNRKVLKSQRTPPKKVVVMDDLEENLLDIDSDLQTLLSELPFTGMQVTLLHYAPTKLAY